MSARFLRGTTLVISLLLCSCGKDIDRILDQVKWATERLQSESQSWQETLKELEQRIASDTQSTIKTEVNSVVQNAVAAAGIETRCSADFLAFRIKLHLQNILARHGRGTEVSIEPAICSIDPKFIDFRIDPGRRQTVNLSGYDMTDVATHRGSVRVFLVDSDNTEKDVTNSLQGPTHYLITLNIGPSGIQPSARASKIAIRWNSKQIGDIAIVRDYAQFTPEIRWNASSKQQHPSVTARLPSEFRLIGGGCRSEWQTSGHLLLASYPDSGSNSWVCRAKDEHDPEEATLTAYVVGVPISLDVKIDIQQSTESPKVAHPSSMARVRDGYKVIGGGCRTTSLDSDIGNFLVDSYPVSDGWQCQSKDHGGSSPATIIAYVIGLRSSVLDVVTGPSVTTQNPHTGRTQEYASLPTNLGAGIVGGGCNVNYGGAGNILYASFPDRDRNRWVCESKDHDVEDRATVVAFPIGLVWSRDRR